MEVEARRTGRDTGISCAAGDDVQHPGERAGLFETREHERRTRRAIVRGEALRGSAVTLAAHPLSLLGSLDTVGRNFNVGFRRPPTSATVGGRLSLGVNDNTPEGNTGNF